MLKPSNTDEPTICGRTGAIAHFYRTDPSHHGKVGERKEVCAGRNFLFVVSLRT